MTLVVDFHDQIQHVSEVAVENYTQVLFTFQNGWGASVIQGEGSYGHQSGRYEMAAVGPDGEADFENPITPYDPEGWLTAERVTEKLSAISKLTSADVQDWKVRQKRLEYMQSLRGMATHIQDLRGFDERTISELPLDLRVASEIIEHYFENADEGDRYTGE